MEMPKVVIVTSNLIEKNGKYLLVQEGHKYAYGLWNFPAGGLESPISLEKNAEKEALEEAGYKVSVKGLVGTYQKVVRSKDHNRTVIVFVFASSIVSGKLRDDYPDSELLQAKWFSEPELRKMKKQLRDKYILQAIRTHKNKKFLGIGNA